jgi:hypothetical protein
MDVTEKEAFRLGFLSRCAEEGLTGEALQERIKQAADGWAGAGTDALTAGALLTVGLPAAAGLVGGGLMGTGLAKFTEPNISEDDVKAQELAQTYKVYADRLRAKRKFYDKYRTAR